MDMIFISEDTRKKLEKWKSLVKLSQEKGKCPDCKNPILWCNCVSRLANEILVEILLEEEEE